MRGWARQVGTRAGGVLDSQWDQQAFLAQMECGISVSERPRQVLTDSCSSVPELAKPVPYPESQPGRRQLEGGYQKAQVCLDFPTEPVWMGVGLTQGPR